VKETTKHKHKISLQHASIRKQERGYRIFLTAEHKAKHDRNQTPRRQHLNNIRRFHRH